MKLLGVFIITILIATSCKKDTITPILPAIPESLYFPPATGSWENVSPESLQWNTTALNDLYNYLQQKNTKGFIILKNGKIAAEKYFGTFTVDSNWYWASAGKTLTACMVGIAQQEGLLNINNKTSNYLGTGWTSLPLSKENLITVKHQLSMTTGLDDGTGDVDCTLPACLQYKTDAGNRWAYHNAPYTLLSDVVENAAGMSFNSYCQQKIKSKIGMNGTWIREQNANNVYYSTPRSMARFGLLMLAQGKWNGTTVLADTVYQTQQTNSSQSLNLSYGYLTWLNGKSSYRLPSTQAVFQGAMVPNAPADMYAALGKNDQKIYVVPSMKLVVIRVGESAGNSMLALSSFDNELWGKIMQVL